MAKRFPTPTVFLSRAGVAAALAAGLSACGGGSDGGGNVVNPPNPPAPPAAKFEDQFGAGFGAAYRVASNADPVEPSPGDLIPLSLTTDPVNF